MEKTVRIAAQQPLRVNEWTSPRTGEKKLIKSVEFTLTDGTDCFTAELTGDEAETLPMLDRTKLYSAQCRMSVREWQTREGQTVRSTSIRLLGLRQLYPAVAQEPEVY